MPAKHKTKLKPRELMEMAVAAMKQSIKEPRADKKASPLVGAVLVKPDGSVDTAHRGELRQGDHAEFTLLERKHRDESLDGSILYATLEPCAPGARRSPKLSCAERIVNARIAKVWVGIEDPDPTVDRQGLRYLEDNGIEVELFEPDFQAEIREANEAFITQALDRAAAAKVVKVAQPIPLSQWDEALPDAKVEDFSSKALTRYREQTKIKEKISTDIFLKRLQRQGLVRRYGRQLRPTGFGLILFGKQPREIIHHSGINMTIEYPDGSHEVKDFDGPAVLIPDSVEQWLIPKLPNVIDRSRMTRKERPVLPFELVREGVINALVHRDYDLTGATCHLVVAADTITIRSPGAPLLPVTIEQMQAFNAPMYNRNPKIQFAFGGTKLLEGRGLGMRTFGEAATKHSLPVPKYAFDGIYLNLTIYRHAQAALNTLDLTILASMSLSERAGWKWLSVKGTSNSRDYAAELTIDVRTARRHLNHFIELGLVRKTGSGPSTSYYLL